MPITGPSAYFSQTSRLAALAMLSGAAACRTASAAPAARVTADGGAEARAPRPDIRTELPPVCGGRKWRRQARAGLKAFKPNRRTEASLLHFQKRLAMAPRFDARRRRPLNSNNKASFL